MIFARCPNTLQLERGFFVNTINVAKRGADFTQRSVGAHRFNCRRHGVLVVLGSLFKLLESIPEDDGEKRSAAKAVFKELKEKVMKDEALERGRRLDGRKFDEIRPITIEAGILPRTHGSTVFTRGETQALVTVTLGTAEDQQKIEMVDGETW